MSNRPFECHPEVIIEAHQAFHWYALSYAQSWLAIGFFGYKSELSFFIKLLGKPLA